MAIKIRKPIDKHSQVSAFEELSLTLVLLENCRSDVVGGSNGQVIKPYQLLVGSLTIRNRLDSRPSPKSAVLQRCAIVFTPDQDLSVKLFLSEGTLNPLIDLETALTYKLYAMPY